MEIIQKTLDLIKKQIGIDLDLCEDFPGIKEHFGLKYFNVILNERLSDSNDFEKLVRFSNKYNIIRVEPNGLKRVSIFIL